MALYVNTACVRVYATPQSPLWELAQLKRKEPCPERGALLLIDAESNSGLVRDLTPHP